MKSKLLGALFSLCISAAIVSGHDVLSKSGIAIAIIFNIAAWLVVFFIPSASEDAIRESIKSRWVTRPSIVVFWVALVYAGHPYLLASSVLVFLLSRILVNERKKRIDEGIE